MAGFADNNITTTKSAQTYVSKHLGLGLYNEMLLIAMADGRRASEFGMQSGGAKTGDTITLTYPPRFVSTDIVDISSGATTNAIKPRTKAITLDKNVIIPFELSVEQVTLEITKDNGPQGETFREVGKQITSDVETYGFEKIAKEAQNVIVLETPYADGAALRKEFVKMRSRLDKNLAPKGDRCAIMSSDTEVEISNSMLPLFHNKKEIDSAFKNGTFKEFGGLGWYASNLVYNRTNGCGGAAGLVIGAYTEGATTITITGIGAAGAVVGDKIEFPGSSLINAQSRLSYATPIQRAVKAIAGDVVTIDPIWGPANPELQNCDILPVATDAITALGTAGEIYSCAPVFQKKGLAFASADLDIPKGTDMAAKTRAQECTISFVRDFAVGTRKYINRVDNLHTWDLIQPEWIGVVEQKIS